MNKYKYRVTQSNNLLKVLTANVQSLSPKIDELITLTQVENFDIIGLNETWLNTQDQHLFAEVAIHMDTRSSQWTNHSKTKTSVSRIRQSPSHCRKY